MVKLGITLLNILLILAVQIFQDNVSVKLEVPTEVQAGTEFEVKVTLNKGDLDGFSRFQQSIPAGLTVSPAVSSNADFSFEENRVRLIWLRIPQNEQITVSYRVKIDERLKGTFNLAGRFSYIENNERKSVDIQPVAINITPSSDIDPSLIVDVNDFERLTMPLPGRMPAEAVSVACIRQKPVPGTQGDYVVNVLVSKNFTRQFAKIEEDIPAGYTAVSIDPKNAIFTFKDQKVKFLWMNLPQEPFFTVSYRLIPRNQAKPAAPQIRGAFSYLVEERTVQVGIIESDFDMAEVSADNIDKLIAMAVTRSSTETTGITQAGTAQAKPVERPEYKTARKDENIPAPAQEEGVYFRVQLAAGHKPVNINRYFRKLDLDRKVQVETHDGWRKYSVGSFHKYREARDYRVHIWNTTPVKDAFITAYNNGERITVQEALMITEQKWVQ